MRGVIIRIAIICLAVLCFNSPALAQEQPPTPPYRFYGGVTIGGNAAPDGTVITAEVGGVEKARVTTSAGKYGYGEEFNVAATVGQTITFKVNGVVAATYTAGEAPGSLIEKDLAVASAPPPTGGGGGGGGGGSSDTVAPTILATSILVSNITKTSADISWKTDEKSDSQVEYWSSPGEFSALDTERVINHLVHLTDLTPATTYHYKTMSRDAAGNLAVSDEHTFTTLGVPATFTISNLSVSPTEVDIGEKVTISAVVANTGDAKGTYEVTLKINGVIEEPKKVDVDAGASKTVTFTTVKDVAGSYAVAVDGLTGSFSVVAPAMFSLSNLSITPQEVKPKEAVTITVSVANTGGTQGSYTVVLKIDEVKEAEKTVTVAAGSSQSVSFTVTRDVAGTYAVVVDGLIGSFSVTPPVKLNWPVVGGIIGGVVIIGLLIFFLVRRRAA